MRHSIDTFLLSKFFQNNPKNDDNISTALLNWFATLESGDGDLIRKSASQFLQILAGHHLRELHLPEKQQQALIEIFEPLENVFRIALSLSKTGQLRDHLSHSIRNYLFSNYILSRMNIAFNSHALKILSIASIFHDVAYPIEKFKKGTKGLSDVIFREYLDSKGTFDWELTDSEKLLDVLDVIGSSHHAGLCYIYSNVVAPAIAGEGLFNAPHCLSSVVLFLRHIVSDWKHSAKYWDSKADDISSIALTMAFHDRKIYPEEVVGSLETRNVVKALRIADELQEWGRDKQAFSYVKNVEVKECGAQDIFLNIEYIIQQPRDCIPFDASIFIGDKLIGLLPVVDTERVNIKFILPDKLQRYFMPRLIKHVESVNFMNNSSERITRSRILFKGNSQLGNAVNVVIYQKAAEIEVVHGTI